MRLVAFMPRARFILTLTAFLLLSLPPPAWSGDTPKERATLKGIPAISVRVEKLKPEVERDGLSEKQLLTDVELRLRKAGIRVTSSNDEVMWSYLSLKVGTYKHASGLYAFHLDLEFNTAVVLERDRSINVIAPTWSVGGIGVVGADNLEALRNTIGDHVDQFINAYLEQNPQR